MSDFNTFLTRSFAEAPEPADEGFSVRVSHAVGRREAALKSSEIVRGVGYALAGAAVLYGLYVLAQALGVQSWLSLAGDEVGNARAALATSSSLGQLSQSAAQVVSASMAQILMGAAALAGGAVAYRTSQA